MNFGRNLNNSGQNLELKGRSIFIVSIIRRADNNITVRTRVMGIINALTTYCSASRGRFERIIGRLHLHFFTTMIMQEMRVKKYEQSVKKGKLNDVFLNNGKKRNKKFA